MLDEYTDTETNLDVFHALRNAATDLHVPAYELVIGISMLSCHAFWYHSKRDCLVS